MSINLSLVVERDTSHFREDVILLTMNDNNAEIIFESNCPRHHTITPITNPRVFRPTVTFKLDHTLDETYQQSIKQ